MLKAFTWSNYLDPFSKNVRLLMFWDSCYKKEISVALKTEISGFGSGFHHLLFVWRLDLIFFIFKK
jgi:hypothetical protein